MGKLVLWRSEAARPLEVHHGVGEGLEEAVHGTAGGGVQVSADDDQVGGVSFGIIF